jgi:PST family polysaccharide transporter
MGFNILNYFSRNSDYIIIGKFLGAVPLGLYTFAYRLMQFPLQYVSNVVGRVLFPTMSMMQDNDQSLRGAYIQACKYVAMVTFPVMTLVSILAPEIVTVIFGEKWVASIPLVRIFGIVGAVQSIITLNGNIYTAKGRTDLLFYWGVISSTVAVLGFVIGVRWGVYGVAIGYALATFVLLIPNFGIPFRLIGQKYSVFVYALRVQIFMTLISSSIIYIVSLFQRSYGVSSIIILITNCVLGLGIYLYGTLIFDRQSIFKLIEDIFGYAPTNLLGIKQIIPSK